MFCLPIFKSNLGKETMQKEKEKVASLESIISSICPNINALFELWNNGRDKLRKMKHGCGKHVKQILDILEMDKKKI